MSFRPVSVLLLYNFISVINAHGDYRNIINNIFQNYDPGIRPVIQSNTTTKVKLHYGIVELLNVVINVTYLLSLFAVLIF